MYLNFSKCDIKYKCRWILHCLNYSWFLLYKILPSCWSQETFILQVLPKIWYLSEREEFYKLLEDTTIQVKGIELLNNEDQLQLDSDMILINHTSLYKYNYMFNHNEILVTINKRLEYDYKNCTCIPIKECMTTSC